MEPPDDPALQETLARPAEPADDPVRLPAQYTLVQLIGRGGMGAVVKATDTVLGRTVAIKMLRTDVVATEDSRARLQREAKILSSLTHPNICSLHGVEEHEGRLFLVMPFCEGETLQAAIDRGLLTRADKLRILKQLLEALTYAHERGVVHRDLKPSNIILGPDGGLRLLDFGIAKRDTDDTLTTEGAVLGTVVNMAPEQLRGATLGPATDLWAVGTIAYELFEGKRPFDGGERMVTAMRILTEPPRPMEQTDEPLQRFVERLLQKKPEDRFASATETMRALDDPSTLRHPRRRSWTPVYVGVGGLAIAGLVSWSVLQKAGPDVGAMPDPTVTSPVFASVDLAPARDLRPTSEDSFVAEAELSPEAGQAFKDAADAYTAKQYDDAARKFEHAYVLSGDVVMLVNAGKAARLAGRKDLGIAIFERALKRKITPRTRMVIEDELRKLRAAP